MASRLRPRTISELVDVEFELLRRHYPSFLTIVALGFAPIVVGGVLMAVSAPVVSRAGEHAPSGEWVLAVIVAALLMCASMAMLQGALIFAASDAYLDDAIDVASAFRRAASEIRTTLVAYLVAGVLTGIGYLCLVVPGIYLVAALFAVPAIVLLEGRGPGEAVRRSFALTRGRKLQVLGALIVAFVISFVGRMTATAAAGVGGSVGVAVAVQIAAFIAFYPLTTIMAVLLYYDLRIRLEGFDIERAAAALQGQPPDAA